MLYIYIYSIYYICFILYNYTLYIYISYNLSATRHFDVWRCYCPMLSQGWRPRWTIATTQGADLRVKLRKQSGENPMGRNGKLWKIPHIEANFWNWIGIYGHNGDIMEHTQQPTVFLGVFVWKSWDTPLCCGDFIGKRWVDDCHPLKLGPNRLARANYRSMIAEVPKHIYVL